MSINDDVESIYRHINQMLRDGDFTEIEDNGDLPF